MEDMQYISLLRFSMQLMICEAVFLVGRARRPHFPLRLAGALLGYLAAASGWYLLLRQVPGRCTPVYIAFWFGLFLLTLGGMLFCFDLLPIELLFVGTSGYATEHLAFALGRIAQYSTGWVEEVIGAAWEFVLFRLLIYVLTAAVVYALVIRPNSTRGAFRPRDVGLMSMALVVLLSAIVLSSFYATGAESRLSMLGGVICPAYGTLCCVLVLTLEYYILRENSFKKEREVMEQMLQMANSQQKSSREAIDIINMKCHDMKHQLRAMASLPDGASRAEYVAELQQALTIYDATYHTGCEALDYILSEKTLLAGQHRVQLSCMAQGECLNFMRAPDIYALMGNALDNALECVLQETEEERIISLQIRRRGQMVSIHLENRCSRPPEFQEGLPVTHKADKNAHGFGVRSIRYIVHKYGGELRMGAEGGMFSLDILLPGEEEGCGAV